MTSSPDADAAPAPAPEPDTHPSRDGATDLPPALSSMWRLCKLGYRHEPRLILASFGLGLLAALPDALIAVWLGMLGTGVLEERRDLLLLAGAGLAASAVSTWYLRTVSTR